MKITAIRNLLRSVTKMEKNPETIMQIMENTAKMPEIVPAPSALQNPSPRLKQIFDTAAAKLIINLFHTPKSLIENAGLALNTAIVKMSDKRLVCREFPEYFPLKDSENVLSIFHKIRTEFKRITRTNPEAQNFFKELRNTIRQKPTKRALELLDCLDSSNNDHQLQTLLLNNEKLGKIDEVIKKIFKNKNYNNNDIKQLQTLLQGINGGDEIVESIETLLKNKPLFKFIDSSISYFIKEQKVKPKRSAQTLK